MKFPMQYAESEKAEGERKKVEENCINILQNSPSRSANSLILLFGTLRARKVWNARLRRF
jgi:hypothetical protein